MTFTLQRKRIDTIPGVKLFAEMERIWKKLGHRPSRIEWEASEPAISYITYRRRFGGWVNACSRFVERKMGSPIVATEEPSESPSVSVAVPNEKKRDVPLKLRLKVLDRDNYSCVLCGRSPVLFSGLSLHIDHRVAYSKAGKTELANLQTLCGECNLGKGNGDIGAKAQQGVQADGPTSGEPAA